MMQLSIDDHFFPVVIIAPQQSLGVSYCNHIVVWLELDGRDILVLAFQGILPIDGTLEVIIYGHVVEEKILGVSCTDEVTM